MQSEDEQDGVKVKIGKEILESEGRKPLYMTFRLSSKPKTPVALSPAAEDTVVIGWISWRHIAEDHMANDRGRLARQGAASLLQEHAALNLWASYT
jgi:hypothetical protein